MKIKIRQHDAGQAQADSWSDVGDWLAELGDDDRFVLPGDGRAEPDGIDDPRPEALAQTDAQLAVQAAVTSPAGPAPSLAVAAAGPGQLSFTPVRAPASLPTVPATPPVAAQPSRPRPLEVAQCSMCGVALPLGLLVPDGGQACAEIRWYCKDAMACTARWTSRPPGGVH